MGLRVNLSSLLARTGLSRLLGQQMNGARDMYGIFGWNTNPKFQDFYNKWKRQGVARRVINAYPDALWADPPQIIGDSVFNSAWQDLLASQPVFANLQKLDKLCRIGKYAILVVGFDDGKQLDQPITAPHGNRQSARKVIYLQPYSEGSTDIVSYETDQSSPRYNLPIMYEVTPGNFDNTKDLRTATPLDQKTFKVHWTRVLHVAEGALESPIFGTSALEPIFNDLDDLEKTSGSSAEIFWLNARQGLHIDVDKEMELKEGDAEALSDEIDEYSNNLRRVIRTRGVKVNALGSDFLNPDNVYDVSLSNVAACTGIPKRVLSGSEAGQLASQQDRANWANRVEERIAEYGSPVVLLPFLRMMIDSSVLPQPTTMTVTWPDAFKMNPLERAQTSAQMARSAANLSKTLFTVQQINHANAMDAVPQPMAGGFGGGGGFFGNASTDPSKSTKGSPKTPNGKPPDATGATGDTQPEPQMQPALLPNAKTDLVLLTEDECRQIIGFGKHMPVFDSKQDAQNEVTPSSDSSPAVIESGSVVE